MTDNDSRRIDSFACSGPADIQAHLQCGELLVELVDTDVVAVVISAVTDPDRRLRDLLGRNAEADTEAAAAAVRKTKTHFTRGHLVVQAPNGRLKSVPMRVVVRAPLRSKVHLTGGAARFTVTGPAADLLATWDSGDLTVADSVAGSTKVRLGDGRVRLGALLGGADLRIGTATLEVGRFAASATVTTGSGTVEFGTIEADVVLTTGAGTITVADAAAGTLKIKTGPGSIRIGVRDGVSARADLSSRGGTARNELPAPRGSERVGLTIDAASTSGDIVVTRA
ncbi:DUF4097 family beta strand repeat-containing protein [Micromonospora sp. RTGN7]|uniref:DUF4097 family beta strand repeat-containing protein n=1 Tax=Micromonospora sp. RTGN7 TaxID=3016526 RepID=UPI0029FEE41B|nr:DUF4097 family beta strand repeat-containing protein [Micromonospora sp. RTGN7]